MMKSFSCKPLIFFVCRETVTYPSETHVGVMTLALSQFRDLLHECVRLGEVLKPVRTLDPVRFVENGPLRRLLVVGSDFRDRERRDTATTRSAGLRNQRCQAHLCPFRGLAFAPDRHRL